MTITQAYLMGVMTTLTPSLLYLAFQLWKYRDEEPT